MEEFYIEKKIYYHDTDSGGIVYYANYLKYFEEGRTEFCFKRGVNIKGLLEKGMLFVIAHVEVDYKSPARYLDTIKIFTSIEKIGRASVNFLQQVKRDELVLVEARVTWICVNKDFRPQAVPETVKKLLL